MPKGELLNRYSSMQALSVLLENVLRNLESKIEPKEWRKHKIGVSRNFFEYVVWNKIFFFNKLPKTSWIEKIPYAELSEDVRPC